MGVRVEEGRTQRGLVDEAQAFRRFALAARSRAAAAVAGEDQVVGVAEQRAQVARRPLGGAGRGQQEVARGAQLVHEVGPVVVEVHRHPVRAEARGARVGVGRAMEERLLPEAAVGDQRGVFLPGVDFQAAVHGVRQLEGGREVDLHAAVVGVGERREGISGDVMPEQARGVGHRLAGGRAGLALRPGGEAGDAHGFRQLESLRITGRGRDVLGAPGVEVEARREDALGVDAFADGIARSADGADAVALVRGGRKSFVPIILREPGAAAGRGVVVGQVDLGLHAFVADPESVASVRAERRRVGVGRARHRLRAGVDGAHVVALQAGEAGGQVERAVGDERDELGRVEVDRIAEVIDQGLGLRGAGRGDDTTVGDVREVGVVRDEVGGRARKFLHRVDVERRGQPTEEEARVRRVAHVPVAHARSVGAAGRPHAGQVALLVREATAGGRVVVRAVRTAADRGGRRGVVVAHGDVVVGEHVGAHGHALVGAGELLELGHGDAGRGEGVETRPQIAGMALRQAAFDLQERGEDDHQHHHRRHDGQREHEGET